MTELTCRDALKGSAATIAAEATASLGVPRRAPAQRAAAGTAWTRSSCGACSAAGTAPL
jgi:hypothetical protein